MHRAEILAVDDGAGFDAGDGVEDDVIVVADEGDLFVQAYAAEVVFEFGGEDLVGWDRDFGEGGFFFADHGCSGAGVGDLALEFIEGIEDAAAPAAIFAGTDNATAELAGAGIIEFLAAVGEAGVVRRFEAYIRIVCGALFQCVEQSLFHDIIPWLGVRDGWRRAMGLLTPCGAGGFKVPGRYRVLQYPLRWEKPSADD